MHLDQLSGYAICSEPRSGSTFLCEALASSDCLGRPDEYLLARDHAARTAGARESQLARILTEGATKNGIYGLKIFSGQFDRLDGLAWTERLPNLKFVHLERLDYLGQAISEARAIQTGRYHSTTTEAGLNPVYDSALIAQQFAALARGHARWRMFFARTGRAPLYLSYERIAADPQAAIDQISALVGVKNAQIDPSRIDHAVQRDGLNAEWRQRFIAEHGDHKRLGDFQRDTFTAMLRRKLKV